MILKTRELFAGLYALEDERVRQFLVIGEERALLFDAGFADSGVLETVRALTDLPIDVVMTHGDPDHSGGLADFGSCRMNAGDWPLVKDGSIALAPLDEGEIVACGDYRFRVIAIPGHSAGGLAFYDEAKGILLGGGQCAERWADLYVRRASRSGCVHCEFGKAGAADPGRCDGAAVPQCMPDRCGLYRAGSGGCTGAA